MGCKGGWGLKRAGKTWKNVSAEDETRGKKWTPEEEISE